MRLRSLLFVPGDSERKAQRGSASSADALIFDLEDSVAGDRKDSARESVAAWVGQNRPNAAFVRVNPYDSGRTEGDLDAVVRPGLAGIVLPKAAGGSDVARLAGDLDRRERVAGVAPGTVKIIVIATETAAALFTLASYAPPHPRLVGLTWGAEDLATAVGAAANRDEAGDWTAPYMLVRSLALFAASAAAVAPIDTLHANFRDLAGLERDCLRARRDGFVGRLAIHPAQVETINRCFTPSAQELDWARRIVAAFTAEPDAGTLGIDGKMIDRPHLIAAQRLLAASL